MIPYVDCTENYNLKNQMWSYLVNKFKVETGLNFWASKVKFILKAEIMSLDSDNCLGVALFDQNFLIKMYLKNKIYKISFLKVYEL